MRQPGWVCLLLAMPLAGAEGPGRICYAVQPNPYLDARAAEVKKIYDGFFSTAGSWEAIAERFVDGGPGEGRAWLESARRNLAWLRQAGVPGKSRLAVTSLNSHGAWIFSVRITDDNDIPFPDLRFRLE